MRVGTLLIRNFTTKSITIPTIWVLPPENLFYVGWVEPGEWFNITVRAEPTGVYTADLLYTSSGGGDIAFDVNEKQIGGPVTISATYNASARSPGGNASRGTGKGFRPDQTAKGGEGLTLRVSTKGHMNFAYLDFKPEPK